MKRHKKIYRHRGREKQRHKERNGKLHRERKWQGLKELHSKWPIQHGHGGSTQHGPYGSS